ncbi:GNAT family N-acetyltransferase [Gracilibacillus oryzae]|uniref:GNAT family N-acetyltransferase n=1 Tax=Gracilibacillus oryzae TaxID=1672701 RepID=A0A7C8GUG1_9BACI|nr:GNAT family N-acetyltransferase [Gracilibacillus oryzae]KAB8136812.1 GNAT family N-acetyltransferase [Gracilibacillus oryzae]
MEEKSQELAKAFLKDKKLNDKSLHKMKDPTLAGEWAKAIAHFIYRNGPVEDIHSNGQLTDADMKTINKYMINQLTGLILTIQREEWFLLDNMLAFYKMFGGNWDNADLTKFNTEKQLVIENIAKIVANNVSDYSAVEPEENIHYIDITYSSSLDEETGVIQYSSTIDNYSVYTDSHENVGRALFSMYNLGIYESWWGVIDAADHYSSEECILIGSLKDVVDEELLYGKCIIFHSLSIEEQFQQKGIGREAMDKLMSYWSILGVEYVILRAAPPITESVDNKRKENIEKLIRFYGSLGFKELDKGSDMEGSVMIMYL